MPTALGSITDPQDILSHSDIPARNIVDKKHRPHYPHMYILNSQPMYCW